MDKKDASGESPKWRWEPWVRRDPRNAEIMGRTISKGYFIEDLENFDAAFFGISPKEAEQMDPHQRLGLEVTWEALEDAGINPKSLSGSDTSVYIGVDSDDYSRLLLEDIPNIEAWMGIGTTAHGIPNRISYHLDLMGPSAAVDAACASSLVAVHSGRQAILAGESRVAIVGGVNVCLSPALFHMLGVAGALSPDGVCLSFDDDAHGYARGEGAAILILEKLSHAILDGGQILATIKGTAVAQDEKTNGIMAPNGKAQELVARKALKQAGIDPLTVGYIEAHATSTSLGDPTEIAAISAVYGDGRPENAPAIIGSIKPNIGHLEAAAGAISLIKGILAVDKGLIPPQTRLTKLNSKVDWARSGLHVPRDAMKWSEVDGPRRAAICSYGYGGTVSHAVIEQSPALDPIPTTFGKAGDVTLLLLSAPQGKRRLELQAATQAQWIAAAGKDINLETIAATLAQHRAHHDFRAAFVISSHSEGAEALTSFSKGLDVDWCSQGRTLETGTNKDVLWVFSGHGAQWPEMGTALLKDPLFRQVLEPLDAIVIEELGFSALTCLERGDIGGSDCVQVLTYLVQIGLSEVLRSKGVRPQAIIGHSVGELAASVTAGCLTPSEGTIVVARRAKLYATVKGLGGMFLVNLSFAAVAAELGNRKDVVAAIESSPSSCVVSGLTAPLCQYIEGLKERGVRTFQVKTDMAFHSPMLEALSSPLKEALANSLKPQPPVLRLYSTSQTDPRSSVPRDADYWIRNMIEAVRLNTAVSAAIDDDYRIFMEISSHPIVSQSIDETLCGKGLDDLTTIPTMKKGQPADKSILHAIAHLHVRGVNIDFATFLGRQWSRDVPKFKWTHKSFWKEVSSPSPSIGNVRDVNKHDMLGEGTTIAGNDTVLFSTIVDDSTRPFPQPHQVHGTDIIPASVYINTFLNATGAKVLSNMDLSVPLAVTDDRRNVQVVVQGGDVKVASRLSAADEQSWIAHSTASWVQESAEPKSSHVDIEAITKRIGTVMSKSFSVDYLFRVGVAGMAFPWAVTSHYANAKEMLITVGSDPKHEIVTWDSHSWAPTFDAASSIGSTLWPNDPKLRIISHIGKVVIHSNSPPPKVFCLHVTEALDESRADARSSNVSVLGVDGELLAELRAIRFADVNATSNSSTSMDGLVHQIAWTPARLSERPLQLDQAILVSRNKAMLEQCESELKRHIPKISTVETAEQLGEIGATDLLRGKGSAIVYCPGFVSSLDEVANSAHSFIWEVRTIVKFIIENKLSTKLFIITNLIFEAESSTALAQGPLYGLARIVASEHSDIWGGLIDNEGTSFPTMPLKYVKDQEVIRYIDGVPRVARMRPFSTGQRHETPSKRTLLPKPEGTYIITGGLGALGLETCDFLVEKGARRVVIVSRRELPSRRHWEKATGTMASIIKRIQAMEKLGLTVHVVSTDIGAANAHEQLLDALDRLSLPPVLGVVHASGVLEDNLLINTTSDSFARVLAPKISGAIALHKAFPPGSLDFFVLYSSIGELVGTSGQSSYASGNAFLDTLAAHRRKQGDNSIAFQWTAWRGLGMATATDFLAIELESKGITDITREEGFRAWEHMSRYDVDHAVVMRTLAYDEGEIVPCALLEEVVAHRPRAQQNSSTQEQAEDKSGNASARPTIPTELKTWLDIKIRTCIAAVMKMSDIDEIDPRVPLADFGVDSVMTIGLRQKIQSELGIKVPQTLMWNYPTVGAMVGWFLGQFEVGKAVST